MLPAWAGFTLRTFQPFALLLHCRNSPMRLSLRYWIGTLVQLGSASSCIRDFPSRPCSTNGQSGRRAAMPPALDVRQHDAM